MFCSIRKSQDAKRKTGKTLGRGRKSSSLLFLSLEDRCVPSTVSNNFGQVPLSFEQNVGQSDAQVQFLSRGPGYGLFLTGTEAVLSLTQTATDRPAARE